MEVTNLIRVIVLLKSMFPQNGEGCLNNTELLYDISTYYVHSLFQFVMCCKGIFVKVFVEFRAFAKGLSH